MKLNIRTVSAFVLLAAAAVMIVLFFQQQGNREETPRQFDIPKQKRSVLLVTIDTTRVDRLEPYGAENVATPALARLASRGIVFEQASAVAPITMVSHTSILSGLNPFEHGVRNNGTHYVPEEITTLAEMLQSEGYRTAAFVSASVLERRYGLDQGFEVYDDDLSAGRDRSPRVVADRPAEATIASAKDWLETLEESEEYFLWVHLYDPHANYSPPPPYRDEYRERLYDGEIAYMDEQIGHLLSHGRVAAAGDQAPIVTVIADHGESLGEHGERTHGILAYNSTIHIPWILRVPGGPSGLRVKAPVGQVDLVPTIMSLLDLDIETEVSGRDLVPLLEGTEVQENVPYYAEAYLPYYTYGWAKIRTLRQGRWKYIESPTPELYQLSRDPQELSNVHEQQPGTAHDMRRDLEEWLERAGDAGEEVSLELDAEAAERLRSLGYLSVGSGSSRGNDDERPDPKEMIDLHVGLENARVFLGDRLYEQAIQALEEVLRRDPENLSALVELIRSYEALGDISEARRIAEKVLEIDPDYQWIYLTLARIEAQDNELERSLELTELAIERDGNNPEARIQHAMALIRLNRDDEGHEVLQQALEQHPEHARLNAIYANLVEFGAAGDRNAAEERLRQAVERDPFLAMGWLNLGKVLEAQGQDQEAAESYREGLKRQQDDVSLRASLGLLLARLGERAEAIQQLREAIRLSPRMRPDLHVNLGAVLAESGQFQEAEKEYDKVLETLPDHPGARNNLAIARYRSGDLAGAKAELQKLVAEFPEQEDAHNNLAAIAVDQQQWKEAEFHSRRALELNDEIVQAWNNLGIALEEQGSMAQAREAYERALALDPNYWTARFNIGILLQKTGALDEAIAAFNKVLTQVPHQADTHLQIALVYGSQRPANKEKARIHANAFLKHAPPQHPRIAEARAFLESL